MQYQIPLAIRTSPSLNYFKQHIKTHLFHHSMRFHPTRRLLPAPLLFLTLVCQQIYYFPLQYKFNSSRSAISLFHKQAAMILPDVVKIVEYVT